MMKAHYVLMADQPQSPNSGRISSMLQDLNAQRTQGAPLSPAPRPMPARPTLPGRPSAPPVNLPTSRPAPVTQTPPITTPVAPFQPKQVIPPPVRAIVAPTPQERPTVAPMPRPSTPPPPPREMAIPAAPAIPRPPTPPITAPTPPGPPVNTSEKQEKTYSSELRVMSADIGNITTGRPAVGIQPAPPPPKTISTPVTAIPTPPRPAAPVIAAPPPSSGGIGRTIGLGLLSLAALGILFWAGFMIFGGSGTPQATTTPSASPTQTLAAAAKTLSGYFRQASSPVELKADGTASVDFANAVAISQPASQQAVRMPITGPFSVSLNQFLAAVANATPKDLETPLAADWAVLAYGQKEQFDTTGTAVTNGNARTRLALISEVKDASATNQAMTSWEADNLAMDMAHLLGYDATKAIIEGFSAGNYRQVPIRYWNFPYADTSIDWAVVTASNNKNYLVISASRESIFFVIDQLMQ